MGLIAVNSLARAILISCTLFVHSFAFSAMGDSQLVDDFVLLDHTGKAQQLYYHDDASAIVLIVQGNGCQIVRSLLADYKTLRDDYAGRGVQVFMLNANPQDTREAIASEAASYAIDIPILHDSAQIIGPSLALNRTAEVLVIDPRDWKIVYRGALNNRVGYERQKKEATEHYVRDALDALIDGKAPVFSEVKSPGCIINFPQRNKQQTISYSDTIVPILKKNCMACHIEGGIAPWAMSEYRMIHGFAPMMREVIRTKRMPPWHADPAVGHWRNDAGLSDEDAQALINWIEAGAERSKGKDPLQSIPPRSDDWPLGEPDLVLEIPAFHVPATGVVEYQFPTVKNPLDKDVWVVAASLIPGDSKVVHHVLMGAADKVVDNMKTDSVFQNYIMGYAPGNESARMPNGTGVFVPVGGEYLFQMHYTPFGKATTDRTRVGLYFADKPPKKFLRQQVVVNTSIEIPANTEQHQEYAYFEFWDDATIYSLVPHSHYRGKSSSFELQYPNGESELILSVPNYDFNWQRTYAFVEPKKVPKGTKIVHSTIYNNSLKNPGNPDPNRTVPWGLQSRDEMLYGSVSYSWDNESTDKPTHSLLTSDTAQWMGYLDKDIDGKVSRAELPAGLRRGIGSKWRLLDSDSDGGLNLKEMEVLFSQMN
ncbi:MAG: hypothetical protein ACR2P1_00280 [Pseudomonadales bacterium]